MPPSNSARMIPQYKNKEEFKKNVGNTGWKAEWAMYSKLSTLPADYCVIHSYPFEYRKGGVARRGEADFIVLGPRGVAVFEVKSAALFFDPDRGWHTRDEPDRRRPDPIEQVNDELDAVVRILSGTTDDSGKEIIWRKEVLCEGAVAFPKTRFQGTIKISGNRCSRLFIDAGSLQNPAEDILESLFQHRQEFQNSESLRRLSPDEIKRAVNRLFPQVASEENRKQTVEEDAFEIEGNTKFALQMIPTFSDRNAGGTWSLQEGVAGSGKTFLAARWARDAALEGKRSLLLCFNRMLAEWHKQNAANRIFDIYTFHSLSFERSQKAGMDWGTSEESEDKKKRDFYENISPARLLEATKYLSDTDRNILYDVIIVDEAQDIRRNWWPAIVAQLRQDRDCELHILLDKEQQLYGENTGIPEDLSGRLQSALPLTVNLRTSKKIGNFITRIGSREIITALPNPEGVEPEIRISVDLLGEADSLIKRLLAEGISPSRIVILCDHARSSRNHVLREVEKLASIRVLDFDSSSLMSGPLLADWTSGRGILVTTPRSFKGLEADVVILLGMSNFRENFTEKDLYVALTRAKCRLYALLQDGEIVRHMKAALNKDSGGTV